MSWSAHRRKTVEVAIVVGALAVVALAATSVMTDGIPLGWDESVYASKSRSLVTDIPASLWGIYRPPGLPLIGLLGGAFGFADANLRAVTLVLGLMTLTAAWALTRVVWGPLAAIIALITAIGAPIVANELVLFHTDLPATGLLLLLMLLCWNEFERRPEPSGLVLAAAPLAAMAFYLRYGTLVSIGGIGIAAVLLWHRQMIRRWRLIGLTLALTIVLFVPHVVDAIGLTGSPVGIVSSASTQVNTTGPFVAAARYLEWLPVQLAHVLGFLIMIAGGAYATVTALDAIRRRELTADARRFVWLFVPAGITAVGLVLLSHPEPRYMLFPVLLGIIAGAGSVSASFHWLNDQPGLARQGRALDLVLVGGILLAAGVVGFLGARRIVALERGGGQSQWLVETGHAIGADADGPCTVATTVPPIVGWYSACEAVPFTRAAADIVDPAGSIGPIYVMFSDIDERRASAELIDLHRRLVDGPMVTSTPADGARPAVEVYRLAP